MLSQLQDKHADLPIWAALPQLRQALQQGNRAILVAPPGAGKSSLVPLALLQEEWLADQCILILEPRRLAARALAWRMAELSEQALGELVGLRTRDENKVGSNTRIEVLTEALLSRRLQSDPELKGVGLVIFDEFHERSLDADLGLALARDVQAGLREDLRLLLMSATLDHQGLSAQLDAPLIEAKGRSYPVDVVYQARGDAPLEQAVARYTRQALRKHEGDVLVFLPGEGEIRRTATQLADVSEGRIQLHPLYGRLDKQAQQAAIAPAAQGQRKVVLATAVAESSITIAGVRVVIDAGLSRQPVYDPNAGFSHLQTRRVSRDSADQRAGRAGRTAPGTCIRLWSSEEVLQAQRSPALRSADLSAVALNVAAWGSAPNWIEQPPEGAWAQAWDTLTALQLVDEQRRINARGRQVSQWGAHPRIGCVLLAARDQAQRAMACDLAALLEFDGRLMRGCDIHQHWLAWRRGGLGSAEKRQLSRDSERWRRRLKLDKQVAECDPGPLLAAGYADRIALARSGKPGRFQMANGRGVRISENDPLAAAKLLVVCDVDGQSEALVRRACVLSESDFMRNFSAQIQWQARVEFNPQRRAVDSVEQRCFRALVLQQRPLPSPRSDLLVQALIDGIRSLGLSCLDFSGSAQKLKFRLAGFSCLGGPAMDEQSLLDEMSQWLGPFLHGLRRLDQITPRLLVEALMARLDYAQLQTFSQQFPEQIRLPNGRSYPLDYAAEDGPVLALRLQDVYGLDATPQVGGEPVLLHLLSPARRPQAVTRDLHSFWRNAWPEVRKQMRGRYPKHNWPEQPWEV